MNDSGTFHAHPTMMYMLGSLVVDVYINCIRILSKLTEYEENLLENGLFTKVEGTMKRKSSLLISHSLELDT